MSRTINDVGINANRRIFDAIQAIAGHGIINPRTGTTYRGTGVSGYVAKIHDDPSDEYYGTIDVKEWNTLTGSETDIELEGYHTGVRLSAIQESSKGFVIIPKLYSDVMIAEESATGTEYVTMYSHVDVIQLDSHDTIVLGVRERKEFEADNESSPDIDDLEETGFRSQTTYKKDKIETEVVDEEGGKRVATTVDAESIAFDVAEGETTFKADKEEVLIKRDDTSQSMKKGETIINVGNEIVKVSTDGVFLGAGSGTSHAVLGEELADILADICDMISQIKTTTQLGPQPPLNLAQFIATKAKIQAWKGALSGFISKKVNVQH